LHFGLTRQTALQQHIGALRGGRDRIAGRRQKADVVLLVGISPGSDGHLAATGPAGLGDQQQAVVERGLDPARIAQHASIGVEGGCLGIDMLVRRPAHAHGQGRGREDRRTVRPRGRQFRADAEGRGQQHAGAIVGIEFAVEVIEAGADRRLVTDPLLDPGLEQAGALAGDLDIVDALQGAGVVIGHGAAVVQQLEVGGRALPANGFAEVEIAEDLEIVQQAAPLGQAAAHRAGDVGGVVSAELEGRSVLGMRGMGGQATGGDQERDGGRAIGSRLAHFAPIDPTFDRA
jgi:hypothetical protein